MPTQSTLKRLAQHPIFPKVKIQHVRIPALTASSEDMSTVFINATVPTTLNVNGKRVPTAAPLAVYELYSRAGIEVVKEACAKKQYCPDDKDVEDVAREQAGEQAEKQFLIEHYGFDEADWKAYCKIMLQGAGRKFSTGGPVLGDPEEEEEGSYQKNRHDRYERQKKEEEEKYKDESTPYLPAHPNWRDDVSVEENRG